jgi:ankyrin repeat protein
VSDTRHELIREFITAVVEDPKRAEHLLRQDRSLINARWMHDETALHYLAIEGFADAVRFLIDHGADVNLPNEFGDSPLVDVAAVSTNEIARILLTAGADPNGPMTPFRYCPLHNAARRGNIELVKLLLHAGANPHYVNGYGETVFDALDEGASTEERERIVRLLESYGTVKGPDTAD